MEECDKQKNAPTCSFVLNAVRIIRFQVNRGFPLVKCSVVRFWGNGWQVGGGRLETLAALAHQMSAVSMWAFIHLFCNITEWGTYRGLQPIRWPSGCALFKINNWDFAKRQTFFGKCIRTEKESVSWSCFLATFIRKGLDDLMTWVESFTWKPWWADEAGSVRQCAPTSDGNQTVQRCCCATAKKQHFLAWFAFLVDSPRPCTKSVTIHLQVPWK